MTTYGYIIARDEASGFPVVITLPTEDIDWVCEGFSSLPDSPFAGVWSVKKEEGVKGVGKQWSSGKEAE